MGGPSRTRHKETAMNDDQPSPEMMLALYAASAATMAVGALAAAGKVSRADLDVLDAVLKAATARSTGFAAVDRQLASLPPMLASARI